MSSLCNFLRFCDLFRFSISVNQWLYNFDRLMKGGSFTELATAANYAEILGLLTILEWSTWLAEHISEYGEVNDNNVQEL